MKTNRKMEIKNTISTYLSKHGNLIFSLTPREIYALGFNDAINSLNSEDFESIKGTSKFLTKEEFKLISSLWGMSKLLLETFNKSNWLMKTFFFADFFSYLKKTNVVISLYKKLNNLPYKETYSNFNQHMDIVKNYIMDGENTLALKHISLIYKNIKK